MHTIRKARLRDAERVSELAIGLLKYHAKFDKSFAPHPEGGKRYENYFRRCVRSPNKLLLVAEVEGIIVGYQLGSIMKKPPVLKMGAYGYLDDAFVVKAYRGRGIATAMIQELLKWFRSRKLRVAEMIVHADNSLALSAWEKMAFKPMMIRMRKRL